MHEDQSKKDKVFLAREETPIDPLARAQKTDSESRTTSSDAPTLPDVRALQPGEIVQERYRVLSLIGTGAMGAVYMVEQIFLQQPLALKTLNPIAASPNNIRRFQQEAKAAGKLNHHNLVRTTDFGLIRGTQPFLVMDLVQGETLSQHLERHGTIGLESALQIFIPLCFAIDYAHHHGVIHRDLKPGNIVLAETKGETIPKIVDFGIAKIIADETEAQALTKTGDVFGTPLYMSPEQCAGGRIDNRTDIYSLGCVLFEALTGAPPFHGATVLETMARHINETQPSLKEASLGGGFPEALEKIVAKMLAKDPDQRYITAGAVAEDLIALQQGNSANVKQTNIGRGAADKQARARVHWWWLAAVGTAIVIGVLVGRLSRDGDKVTPTAKIEEAAPFEGPIPRNDDETPFSQSEPGASLKTFNFGSAKLGDLILNLTTDVPAQGTVSVPTHAPLAFRTNWEVIKSYPTLFRRFRPDDLYVLVIIDDNKATRYGDLGDTGEGQFADDALFFARQLTSLHQLYVTGPISLQGLTNMQINRLPINVLVLEGATMTGAEFCQAVNLRELVNLSIKNLKNKDGTSIDDGGLIVERLQQSPTIENLILKNCGLRDSDLDRIAKFPHLYNLDVSHNPKLSAKAIARLARIKRIRQINILNTAAHPADNSICPEFDGRVYTADGWLKYPNAR